MTEQEVTPGTPVYFTIDGELINGSVEEVDNPNLCAIVLCGEHCEVRFHEVPFEDLTLYTPPPVGN